MHAAGAVRIGRPRPISTAEGNLRNYPWSLESITEETIPMKAIVVTDQTAGTAGMKLVERPEPPAAINDVIVQIYASGFVPTEMAWPSTWTDRRDRDPR